MSVLLLTLFLSFGVSLLGKVLADAFLISRVSIIGSFVGLQSAVNPGIAFSITFPWHLQGVLVTLALLLLFWAALKTRTNISRIAFGLMLGGAIANIVDRLRDGLVTDFFQVGLFPIFNVADSCITIGVGLLVLEAWVRWRNK